MAGLRQQRAGLHPSLPRAPTAVGDERGDMADLPLKSSDHISDALVSLHWLRIPERIQHKVAVLGCQVLHGSAPRNMGPLTRVADLPGPRTLRSAVINHLVLPSVKLSTVGSRDFPDVASSIRRQCTNCTVILTSSEIFPVQTFIPGHSSVVYIF